MDDNYGSSGVVRLREVPANELIDIVGDALELLGIEIVRYRGYSGHEYSVRRRVEPDRSKG